jgi:hypothetical protein
VRVRRVVVVRFAFAMNYRINKMSPMRITVPDSLLRRLEAKAALDGMTLEEMIRALVERGLRSPASSMAIASAKLPTIRLGKPLNLPRPSNTGLFDLLDTAAA